MTATLRSSTPARTTRCTNRVGRHRSARPRTYQHHRSGESRRGPRQFVGRKRCLVGVRRGHRYPSLRPDHRGRLSAARRERFPRPAGKSAPCHRRQRDRRRRHRPDRLGRRRLGRGQLRAGGDRLGRPHFRPARARATEQRFARYPGHRPRRLLRNALPRLQRTEVPHPHSGFGSLQLSHNGIWRFTTRETPSPCAGCTAPGRTTTGPSSNAAGKAPPISSLLWRSETRAGIARERSADSPVALSCTGPNRNPLRISKVQHRAGRRGLRRTVRHRLAIADLDQVGRKVRL